MKKLTQAKQIMQVLWALEKGGILKGYPRKFAS
jgi:hypothetical protein